MKIDSKFLEKHDACSQGKEWFLAEGITDPVEGIKNLVAKDHWDWANWLIVRVMTRKQRIAYAIFSAKQVIDIYEKTYPDDKRPQNAIEAAKAVLKNDTEVTRTAAYAATAAAFDATDAAATDAATDAAAYAADAAAYAAAYAATAAADATDAAYFAAYSASRAASRAARATAYAALKEMQKRIIEYGISLLKKEKRDHA